MKKRILSILMSLAMVLSIAPVGAFNLTASAATSGNYTYMVSGGKATITDFPTSYSGSLTIPSTLGGYPVTSIGTSAFYSCSKLTSITIPDSVTSIGWSAFYECTSLQSVTIPDSVTSIGDGAFKDCDSLKSVTIPDSVTSIGRSAFYDCYNLTSVTIPDGVTSIGDYAFYHTAYYSNYKNWEDGVLLYIGNHLIESDRSLSGSYSVKSGTKTIADTAFYKCDRLTSITIPDSVTSIGEYAFYYCYSLTSVTIPDSVTSIGWSAFEDCSSLTSVTIGSSVTSIGGDAFSGCSSLQSITIPNSVTSIGGSAFSGCSSLQSITIPNSVTSIGYWAFSGCSSLTSVTIPNSVTSIDWYAFEYCSSLTSVTIGSSVTSIGGYAFCGCSGLKSVTIPDSVTSIGEYAFYDCSSLQSVTIPDSVTSIGCDAFSYCSGLTSITIPKGVTSIVEGAFRGCSGLKSVTIPNSVTIIGDCAFYNCSGLTSITIPDSVTSIGSFAFFGCLNLNKVNILDVAAWCKIDFADYHSNPLFYAKNLYLNEELVKELYIPEGVTAIGKYAFYGCPNLTSVTIEDGVTSIGASAFEGCEKLELIFMPETVTSVRVYAFNGCSNKIKILNPAGDYIIIYVVDGNSTTQAKPHGTSVSITSDIPTKSGYVFKGWSKNVIGEVAYNAGSTYSVNQSIILYPVWVSVCQTCGGDGKTEKTEQVSCEKTTSILKCRKCGSSNIYVGQISMCGSCGTYSNVYYDTSTCSRCNGAGYYNSTKTYTCTDCTDGTQKYSPAKIDSFTYLSKTCNSIVLEKIEGAEYRCGSNGTWQDSNVFTGLSSETEFRFYIRYKETAYTSPGSTNSIYVSTLAHKWNAGTITVKPTCANFGEKTFTCTICGETRTDTIGIKAHTYTNDCDETCNVCKAETRWRNHSYETTETKATLLKNGSVIRKCTVCGSVARNTVIKYAKTFKLSAKSYTYSGSAKKPTVKVYDSAGKLISSSNYTVSYKNNKNVGKATATITFKGNYSGTKTLTFTINPKSTSVSKVTAAKKSLKVSIKKQTKEVTGYEIQYSTSKKFKSAKKVTIKKAKTTSATIKKLKAKKTYYVRVRTYKTVGGKKYYSGWSTIKYKKTK